MSSRPNHELAEGGVETCLPVGRDSLIHHTKQYLLIKKFITIKRDSSAMLGMTKIFKITNK
ncbi:hypothetical protein COX67_01900 [Candidatus Falkowbacteria bacterium CG_4_10_14_0_2_um_filter_36_22]|uniref:Uncharacterized protein n=1 Tax=Candidatus Falkowbacteria bacterium CG02_land_8_20_14_3_00_36_14 TaxID=1974560 RepID=A0A2M7DLA1_9BACT|nr:MAG: hypothetical protein COS18_04685 [Candidatus Falkowbacteria bacterium CG02_land_8_20_14_3_00_36_14]PJA11037.1 MAG: hypothetical protein COX67_01900 [Candidatus Falkowbacteria bacterium CG_4_10_14_0_2_um_filter_36_22]